MKDPSEPRLPPGGGIKLFAAASFLAGGLAILVYAILRISGAVKDNGGTGVDIAAIGFVVVFLALAYGMVRAVFPPKARGVTVQVDRTDVKRGEDVVVRVDVGPRASGKLQLGLVCGEFYDEKGYDAQGHTTRSTASATAFEDWHALDQGSGQTMTLRVPTDAPYSYRGSCISYVWRVSAREPRRLRFDPATNVPLVVRP